MDLGNNPGDAGIADLGDRCPERRPQQQGKREERGNAPQATTHDEPRSLQFGCRFD